MSPRRLHLPPRTRLRGTPILIEYRGRAAFALTPMHFSVMQRVRRDLFAAEAVAANPRRRVHALITDATHPLTADRISPNTTED